MSDNMFYYYVSTSCGVTLVADTDIESARKQALLSVGLDFFEYIRPATTDDIAWVRSMGGHVPEL